MARLRFVRVVCCQTGQRVHIPTNSRSSVNAVARTSTRAADAGCDAGGRPWSSSAGPRDPALRTTGSRGPASGARQVGWVVSTMVCTTRTGEPTGRRATRRRGHLAVMCTADAGGPPCGAPRGDRPGRPAGRGTGLEWNPVGGAGVEPIPPTGRWRVGPRPEPTSGEAGGDDGRSPCILLGCETNV